ncbi:MAG: response regulator [Candidatus Melainabacteria bacterium]|nr:response regulator [Candidatus Melainabacteria bacterium]MBI3309083.1 response regulator [Candidatus Melainabacteria bacterium]
MTVQPPTKVLVISSDKEDLVLHLYETGFNVETASNVSEAERLIQETKFDLILVLSELAGDHGVGFCNYIRSLQISPRPIIVFLIDENKPEEKIEVLRAGADDAVSYPISSKELMFRVMAHIRRRQETHVTLLTGLPDAVMANNVLEYCLKEVNDWAVLSVDLDNLRIYNEAYGHKRGDQMIQALAAVLRSVLVEDDFLSHRDSDDFLLITKSDRAESIAEEICRRFDFIAPRFYTQKDAGRGYVVAVGPKGIRRRVPLISISIGITAKGRRNFSSAVEVLQVVRDMRYLAKSKNGSDWVSDRLRLATSESTQADKRIKILVVEPDASMSLLLRDTLEMEGYSVEVAHSPQEGWELIHSWRPELILLETEVEANGFDGWDLSRKIKQDSSYAGIWLVMSTKNPDHSKALECGADLYLPKPFELNILFTEIRYLLRARLRSKILL